MSYLALSESELSQWHHHWFWGMRYGVGGDLSSRFDVLARVLSEDMVQCRQIAVEIAGMSGRSIWVRGWYWLFNWNNYRTRYYQFQAYLCLKLYEEGLFTQEGSSFGYGGRLVTEASLQFFISRQGFSGMLELLRTFSSFCHRVISKLKSHFFGSSASLSLVKLGPSPLEQLKPSYQDDSLPILVTEKLSVLLKPLGMEKVPGDFVSVLEIRQAYRKASRAVHPDRHQGSQEAFCALSEAYESVMQAINGVPSDEQGLSSDFIARCWALIFEAYEVLAQLKECRRRYAMNAEIIEKNEQLLREYDERIARAQEDLKAAQEDLKAAKEELRVARQGRVDSDHLVEILGAHAKVYDEYLAYVNTCPPAKPVDPSEIALPEDDDLIAKYTNNFEQAEQLRCIIWVHRLRNLGDPSRVLAAFVFFSSTNPAFDRFCQEDFSATRVLNKLRKSKLFGTRIENIWSPRVLFRSVTANHTGDLDNLDDLDDEKERSMLPSPPSR